MNIITLADVPLLDFTDLDHRAKIVAHVERILAHQEGFVRTERTDDDRFNPNTCAVFIYKVDIFDARRSRKPGAELAHELIEAFIDVPMQKLKSRDILYTPVKIELHPGALLVRTSMGTYK